MASDRKETFLEGFEAGLRAAWNEVIKMASRGYSSTELGVMAKTRLATLHRDVEAEAARLDEGSAVAADEAGEISERGSYLVNEEKADSVYGHFRDLLRAGARGLAITRAHPTDVGKRFQLGEVEAIWLSRTADKTKAGDVAIADPTNLVALAGAVIAFLEAGGSAAVVLEGLEYLVSLNGFGSVLRFLQTLNEKIVVKDSYLLIAANADAMKEQEYRLLAKEMAGEL
jgi:hypothetical protein